MTITVTFAQSFDSTLDIVNPSGVGPTTTPQVLGLAGGGWVSAGTSGNQTILNGTLGVNAPVVAVQNGTGATMAALTDGRILVVTDQGSQSVIAIYDSAGLNTSSITTVDRPNESAFAVAALPGGAFVVASQRQYVADTDISIRFHNSAGDVVNDVSLGEINLDERAPSIATRPDGTVCLAWEKQNGANTEIWVAVYDANGNVVQAPVVLDANGSINKAPVVVATETGFAIAYEDNGWFTGGTDITVATISATGVFENYLNISNPSLALSALNETAAALVHLGDDVVALAYAAESSGGTANDTLTVIADLTTETVWPPNGVGGGGLTVLNNAVAPAIALIGPSILHVYQQDTTAGDITGGGFRLIRVQQSNAADDTMFATRFFDSFVGGGGNDTVDYSAIQTAIDVDLSTGLGAGGAGGDVLIAINRLIGTGFDDQLTGGNAVETMFGGDGNDTLFDQDGINFDRHEGGNGVGDWIDYSVNTFTAVLIDLLAGQTRVLSSGGNTETLVNIENVRASQGNDFLQGNGFDNTLSGEGGDDRIVADAGRDWLDGGTGNDYLDGGADNDTIDGGSGIDTLIGGVGNDTLLVRNAASIILESVGFGTADRLLASVSFGLAADDDVETLQTTSFAGTAAINLTGNALGQSITGNAGVNTLDGGTGVDTLAGGAGNDTLILRNAASVIVEGVGQGTEDAVLAAVSFVLAADDHVEILRTTEFDGTAPINLTGNQRGQFITGNAGANTLDDGTGVATLAGGAGNDTLIVRNAATAIAEGATGGTADRVLAAVSFALEEYDDVETLQTTSFAGTGAINLTGNSYGQNIIGNAGVNTLDGGTDGEGGARADTLTGGAGNDTLILRNSASVIVEGVGQGAADRVLAAFNFGLAADDNIETLQTTSYSGTSAINLTGNALGQSVIGNAGVNRLDGKAGNDILTGGNGADVFVFTTALGAGNVDTITDYNLADRIQVDNAVFAGLALGALTAFAANAAGAAVGLAAQIIYETDTGFLWFDSNGTSAGGRTQFADLAGGLGMTINEFTVV